MTASPTDGEIARPGTAQRRLAPHRVALALGLALASACVAAQIPLRSREVIASSETTAAFVDAVKRAAAARHGLVTLNRHPTANDRALLERLGVSVLSALHGTTYRARVSSAVDAKALAESELEPRLVMLDGRDKINPILLGSDFRWYSPKANEQPDGPNWVLSEDGQSIAVGVRLQPGIADGDAKRLMLGYSRHARKYADSVWRITVARARVAELVQEDSVQWVDAGPLPFRPDNDRTRAALNVDPLHAVDPAVGTPAGLTGRGVQVGVFDRGVSPHRGFGNRLFKTHRNREFHGTHIAGIIGGSGALSEIDFRDRPEDKGRPMAWRGMAPGAELLDVYQNPPHGRSGADVILHQRLIAKHGMDISNHSYAINFWHPEQRVDGSYDLHNQIRDELIRGDALADGRSVPARLHVTSAGNRGEMESFSINKQVKNALVVGAWNTRTWRRYGFSSQGPTADGRIKPDVMAPGVAVMSAGYCAPGDAAEREGGARGEPKCVVGDTVVEKTDFYRGLNGTSQATAVATGVLALVLEQYVKSFAVNLDAQPPLPSTLRGVLVHTARNDPKAPEALLAMPDALSSSTRDRLEEESRNPPADPAAAEVRRRQPSFAGGWGLIDAAAAVRTVRERSIVEDRLDATCESITYRFDMPPTADGWVRITLAWDDPRADPALREDVPRLVNDLDLVVTAPGGEVYRPWQIDQDFGDGEGQAKSCAAHVTPARRFVKSLDPEERKVRAGEVTVRRGPDRLNNLEVVDAPWSKGSWSVQVVGFSIADGPQKFSLIGMPPGIAKRDVAAVNAAAVESLRR